MLNARDLKEYRIRRGFSQRDVSMYCNLTYRAIGMIENGERGLSEESYREIVQGINAATMARTQVTFEEDKKKFNEKENAYERERVRKATEKKATQTKRKSTKPTSSKTVRAEKQKEDEVLRCIFDVIVGTYMGIWTRLRKWNLTEIRVLLNRSC